MPSRRSEVDLRPNRLSRALAARSPSRGYLDLTVSNPTRAEIPYAAERIRAAFGSDAILDYDPEPFGSWAAREAVARLWAARGISADPSRIVLTSSTSESYAFLFKLLCDPGDNVLVPRPSYPLFEHLARYEGVEVRQYALEYDGAWHVNFASIDAAKNDATRAVVVVTPNNPTGSLLKRDELERLARLNLPIVSDEVFGEYLLKDDPRRVRSALEADGALVFALDGLSKFAALPQMKLGWITMSGPLDGVEECRARLEFIADNFLSPSVPVQHAAAALIESSSVARDAIRERLGKNLRELVRLSENTALTPLLPEGGLYVPVRLPALRTEEAWSVALLEHSDVLVQPGYFYDFSIEPVVVLSLLTPEQLFSAGLRRIVDYVARG